MEPGVRGAIRWKRGAIRLWVVLSGIWCVGVVSIMTATTPIEWPSLGEAHLNLAQAPGNMGSADTPPLSGGKQPAAAKRKTVIQWEDAPDVPPTPATKADPKQTVDEILGPEKPKGGKSTFSVDEFLGPAPAARTTTLTPVDYDPFTQKGSVKMPFGRAVVTALAIAGGPPLFVLLIGVAFSWVLAGFRRA